MRQVHIYARELRRRVLHGGQGTQTAALSVARLVRQLPGRGSHYLALREALVHRAHRMAGARLGGESLTEAHSRLVQACRGCHAKHGPEFLHRVEALRLP